MYVYNKELYNMIRGIPKNLSTYCINGSIAPKKIREVTNRLSF